MSGYSEASRAAFKRVDVNAGQQRIIDFLRARPRLRPTRQQIADLSGMKLQTVCARINELLYDFNPPKVRELAIRDGAHPLELIENAATEMPKSASCGSDDRADNRNRPVTTSSGNALCDARHPSTSPAASRKPVYIVPYLPHRMSMTLVEAQRATGLEADLVRKARRQFRIWGNNIQFCADVDALIHAPDRVAA